MHQHNGVQSPDGQSNPWIILVVVCLGFFLVSLDTSIVNIAIPTILTNLQASLDQLLWVVNAYLIIFTALLIVSGRLGDLIGQRLMLLLGIVLFLAASAGAGLAQNGTQLIAARIVQGVGAAFLTPQTLSIIFMTFKREKLGAAFGIYGAITGFASVLGPTVGGSIVTAFGWRWIFFINIPFGIITILLILWLVPEMKAPRTHHLDIAGTALATLSLLTIAFGLIEGPRYGWGTVFSFVTIPEIIVVGVLLGIAFVLVERVQREPLVPLRLFADRNYSLSNVVSAALFFSQFGLAISAVLYLQSVLSLTPLQAGLIYFPLGLLSMMAAPVSGLLSSRVGGKWLVMLGLSLYALAILALALFARVNTAWWMLVPIFALGGIGAGCTFPPLFEISLRNLDKSLAGAASGVMNTTRQLGGVLGSAIIGAILQSFLAASLISEAAARAGQLPASLHTSFINAVSQVAAKGLQIGSPEGGVSFPAPAGLAQQVQELYHQVFIHAYVQAMQPTLIVPVIVLLLCALACLTIQPAKDGSKAGGHFMFGPPEDEVEITPPSSLAEDELGDKQKVQVEGD
ncbi:MAG TPA: MFS transporter [Ktedonosporobacter sp.]|nr:MFS transporter [Ktedonosporobacter sp.]